MENSPAEINKISHQRLSYNNHFLDLNYRKELLSFVMIYFSQLKYSHNLSLINSLAFLLSHDRAIKYMQAKKIIRKELRLVDNPIVFYKAILK